MPNKKVLYFKNARKKKKLILKYDKIVRFFLLIRDNASARDFIVNRMKEKDVEFDIDSALNEEFFSGLSDLIKLESIGCVVFNHRFFHFVQDTMSIPYNKN